MRTPRFRELLNLLAVAVLTGVGFLSVYTARQQEITSTSLIYAGFFLALYFVAHLGLRAGLPSGPQHCGDVRVYIVQTTPRWPPSSSSGQIMCSLHQRPEPS